MVRVDPSEAVVREFHFGLDNRCDKFTVYISFPFRCLLLASYSLHPSLLLARASRVGIAWDLFRRCCRLILEFQICVDIRSVVQRS